MTQTQGHALIGHQDIGDSFSGVYYVESVYVKKTVQNKDYSDFMLRDRSGARNAKFWGVIQNVAKGDFLFISAVVEEYMGNPSIIAKNAEKADIPADMTNYIPVYDDSEKYAERFDTIRKELAEMEKSTGGELAGLLVDEVYNNSTFFQKWISAPGSSKPHYGRQGGLLANTVRVADACFRAMDADGLNEQEKVVMVAASLLCRIGGIDAFEFQDCMPVMTKKGKLLGIGNLTMTRVSSALKRVNAAMTKANKPIDQEVMIRILHAIASHDSQSVMPMTKEAMRLGSAYRSDAEMVEAMDFIANDQNMSEEFTAYDPSMKRRYYTGIRAV